MRRLLLTLGKQTIVYGLSGAAVQAVGLVTLPIFARTFSPHDYGTLEVATVGLSALLVLADLGMASASQRSFFDYPEQQVRERGAVLATAITAALAAALVLSAVLIVYRMPIAGWVLDDKLRAGVVIWVAVALPLGILATLLREVMRLHFEAWHYATSAGISAAVTGIVGIVLVLAAHQGIEGVLIGVVAGHAVAAAYGLVIAGARIGRRVSRRDLRVMLRFGLPLLPAAAALWGLSFLDRLMLSRLSTLNEVGQYAVASRFAMVLMFVVSAFGLAYSPFTLQLWAEDRELEKRVRSRALTYVAVGLTTASVILSLFAREAATVVAPAFTESYRSVGLLCIGVTLFGISAVTMSGISFARRTGYFAAYSFGAVAVNAAINAVLIPPLGGVGAAIATAVAYGLLATLYYVTSQRLYPTPYRPAKAAAVVVVGACVMPLSLLPLGWASVLAKLAGLAVYGLSLLVLHVFDAAEISELRAIVRRAPAAEAEPVSTTIA